MGRKIGYDLASFHCTFFLVYVVIKAFRNMSYLSPKGAYFCRVFYEEVDVAGIQQERLSISEEEKRVWLGMQLS